MEVATNAVSRKWMLEAVLGAQIYRKDEQAIRLIAEVMPQLLFHARHDV
jgi:hypothetical protein